MESSSARKQAQLQVIRVISGLINMPVVCSLAGIYCAAVTVSENRTSSKRDKKLWEVKLKLVNFCLMFSLCSNKADVYPPPPTGGCSKKQAYSRLYG